MLQIEKHRGCAYATHFFKTPKIKFCGENRGNAHQDVRPVIIWPAVTIRDYTWHSFQKGGPALGDGSVSLSIRRPKLRARDRSTRSTTSGSEDRQLLNRWIDAGMLGERCCTVERPVQRLDRKDKYVFVIKLRIWDGYSEKKNVWKLRGYSKGASEGEGDGAR